MGPQPETLTVDNLFRAGWNQEFHSSTTLANGSVNKVTTNLPPTGLQWIAN
jgi:hypothetical protein